MSKPRVFIIESPNARDFYIDRLDGRAARDVLKLENTQVQYRVALDKQHLIKSIKEATDLQCDVLHLSCHGDDVGIQLGSMSNIDWLELAGLLHAFATPQRILVMSSCAGGSVGLTKALVHQGTIFGWVLGAADNVGFTDSCLAWSILYRLLEALDRPCDTETARRAVDAINALVKGNFLYRRWDASLKRYLVYPKYPNA
ncbi:hypothetical protein [Xanthomonas euroxanthea]|uniref:hypothetical protein n=1 Tax=Xanthomonas euroxanthea TaxID=2259622 RepID=UPI00161DA931|nr:hypothetical protein [Xanthomonas euroxanthea]MBB5766538.1 hypothetical protein [Xanthomonas euroxanthea]